MIVPDKHMNLEISVLNISAFILSNVKLGQEVSYDNLLNKSVKELGKSSTENFPYAINFLFLLGKISYNEISDSFFVK